jgi:hypothetical protein
MRKLLTASAFLWSLAASAQSGAEITMPPHASQSGLFPFANRCLNAQAFKISAVPPEDWLKIEPATVRVGPDTSFAVRVTVNTSANLNLGKYRSSLMVVCTSCAATDPPCLQDAREFPIAMTIANVRAPGEFQPMATPSVPVPARTPEHVRIPIVPPDPPRSSRNRLLPFVALGLLATGVMVAIVALRGLFAVRATPEVVREMRAESERHQVRR